MKTLENKLIVYDSNCRVCVSMRRMILSVTSLSPETTVAFKSLTPDVKAQVDVNRFRNEMALVDLEKRETLYGADGVKYIFSACWPWFNLLIRIPAFSLIFRVLYKTIAFNRYVIATPVNNIQCDCYPELNYRFRAAYIFICFFIAVLITAFYGAAISAVFNISTLSGAFHMLLIAGSGWALHFLFAGLIFRKTFSDYAGHLATVMFAGVVPLLLPVTATPFLDSSSVVLLAGSVSISFPLMLFMHFKRVQSLGLSQVLTVTWTVFLLTSALFWIKTLGYVSI